MSSSSTPGPAVAVRAVTKRYGATLALDAVSTAFTRGAVTAVIGANGSGKTTLLRILAGLVTPTAGQVQGPDRRPVRRLSEAQSQGIVLVPQEPTIAGHLSVWQNVALGCPEASSGPFLRDRRARTFAARFTAGLLPDTMLDAPAARLNKSSRQLVQLAAAMARRPAVLMLDEPTAVLDEDGVMALHTLVRRFVSGGGTVVIVSHRLRDVLELADDVVVLRNGTVGHCGPVTPGTEHRIVQLLSAAERASRAAHIPDVSRVVLEAAGIKGWRGLDIEHLAVHRGEIVGIAGQSGSGRSRLAAVLAGAHPAEGTIRVGGCSLALGNIRSAQAAGVFYIPEDRHSTAIMANQPVSTNLLVGRTDHRLRCGPFRRRTAERIESESLIERFEVRPADPARTAGLLSGGNQQKLVVGRALSREGKVIVADEPTQGVDASARQAIHAALMDAAAAGMGVVAVCSDFGELFDISDRIIVLRDGRVVLEATRGQANLAEVLGASLGSHPAPVKPRAVTPESRST